MTLQFITGDASCDHEKVYLQLASDWLVNNNHEVFFIVPNYNKFEREQEILSALKKLEKQSEFSTIRSQVYSFHRLAWYFLQPTGLLGVKTISEVGSSMIMRRVLEQLQDQLLIFKGEVNKTGFITKLLELYQEFQLGNVDIAKLDFGTITKDLKEQDFQAKMNELKLIFTAYETELTTRQLQVDQPVKLLADYLAAREDSLDEKLEEKLFIISGFSNFNMQERQLLQVLMQKGHLCVDLYLENVHKADDPFDLFKESKESYYLLKNFAQSQQTPVFFDQKAKPLEDVDPGYLELEKLFKNSSQGKYQQESNLDHFVQIWKAENPEEELRQIATEIRRLVSQSAGSKEMLYYRDIQLLTLDENTYYPLIPPIFKELEVPFYLDEDRKMEQHPLVEFIQALFALDSYYYRRTDVFRFLRTELYLPASVRKQASDWQAAVEQFRQLVDLTENEALANDFHGLDWTRKQDWEIFKFGFEEDKISQLEQLTNGLRNDFRQEIVTFFKGLKKSASTKEALTLFYQFLIDIGVEDQLLYWRDQEIAWGNLEEGRNHEQTWAALMDLLDEYMQIYGTEPFNFDLFKDILSSGLENLSFGKIPTAIDQVQINPLDLARPNQARITFAIGLDNTQFPRTVENKSLISTEERQNLNDQLTEGQFLADKALQTVQNEPFVAYNMLVSASQKIYLTYAKNTDGKQNIPISNYLKQLLNSSDLQLQERKSLSLASDPQYYVGSYQSLIRQLNSLARQAKAEKQNLPDSWQTLKQDLLHSDKSNLAKRAFASQDYQNLPVSLSPAVAQKLYGKDLYSSISRMETFYNCQYQYYARFGLALAPREVNGLDPAVTGEFFHEALDQFMKTLINEQLSLTQLSQADLDHFVEQVLENIFGNERYAFMNRSARMNFIRYQLAKTIRRVSWGLQKQAEKTQLSPVQTEVLFGQIAGNLGIAGLEFPLNNGGKLYLRGKIDRVDSVEIKGQTWLAVIDYKSSVHKFDLTDSYYGLAMQLLTYLDVALKDAVELVGRKEVQAVGAYYFHVHDAVLDSHDELEKARLQQYKFDGIFADEPEIFEALDQTLAAKESSAVFPIKKNKNEQWGKPAGNKFYSSTEMLQLMQHNRRKLQEAGENIVAGSLELNPAYKVSDQKRACQFCPFRSICNFDPMLTENNYHRIQTLNKKELMERLEEEEHD